MTGKPSCKVIFIYVNLIQLIKSIFVFIRIGMMPLTMLVPVLGFWSSQEFTGDWITISFLALTGASAHIFGFGINDLIDLRIDQHAEYRKSNPLLTGALSKTAGWIIVVIQIPLMFFFYNFGYVIELMEEGNFLLISSVLFSLIYNRFSKRGVIPRLIAELSLATSISLLCLAGAFVIDHSVSLMQIVFSISLGLVLLSINSYGSGLKDLKSDFQAKARSFIIVSGARMIGDDRIFITKRLRFWSLLCQLSIITSVFIYLVIAQKVHWSLLFVIIFFLVATFHIRLINSQKRFSDLMDQNPMLYGYLNLIALILLEFTIIPVAFNIILIGFGIGFSFLYFRSKFSNS